MSGWETASETLPPVNGKASVSSSIFFVLDIVPIISCRGFVEEARGCRIRQLSLQTILDFLYTEKRAGCVDCICETLLLDVFSRVLVWFKRHGVVSAMIGITDFCYGESGS